MNNIIDLEQKLEEIIAEQINICTKYGAVTVVDNIPYKDRQRLEQLQKLEIKILSLLAKFEACPQNNPNKHREI